jgi:hypothetical protein
VSWVNSPANDPYQIPWRRHTSRKPPLSTWDRFNSKLRDDGGECWAWGGAHFTQNGYACFNMKMGGRWQPTVAHRVAYELYRAEVPPGLVLDHLCRNHWCVNPWHLEPVTYAVNAQRGVAPSALFGTLGRCGRGHVLTPEMTITRPNGKRECRICSRERDRARNVNGGRREHYHAMYLKRKAAASASRGGDAL